MPNRIGSPTISLRDAFGSKRLQERLLARSVRNPSTECVEWQGYVGPNGYGSLGVGNKRVVQAHRASYAAFKGEFDERLFVLHRCDNRRCISPDHLFVGTRQDNMRDMVAKGRHSKLRTRGEDCSFSSLTNSQAKAIRKRHAAGWSQKDLASEYGVRANTIQRIVRNKTYVVGE